MGINKEVSAAWGGKIAVGSGTGWYINSHQAIYPGHRAPVVVALYRLNSCQGRPAYRRYIWYRCGRSLALGPVAC
jgi:hypothetical protein